MHGARWLAVSMIAASVLCTAGILAAQQPPPPDQRPGQPTPVPAPPIGPATPSQPGPPGQPAPLPKAEEPEAPLPPERVIQPAQPVPEDPLRSPSPTVLPPQIFVGPDLFNPPATQGWLTLTPSFTLSGEYNDNIFLDNRDRRTDGIFGLTPGVTLSVQRPNYRILGGYNIGGQLYVDNHDLSNFGNEQRFFTDAWYQISRSVEFSLSDTFVFSRDSNSLTSSAISVGRQSGWRNTITPQVRWQATPNTALSFFASYTALRFSESKDSDSDTYRAGVSADYRFTQRLTGSATMQVGYLDVRSEEPAWTYSPSLGLTYQITPTLTGYVAGGPTIVERNGSDTTISPAYRIGLAQFFKFGSLQVGYDRAVTAETVGVADSQSVFASLVVPTLLRGLRLNFTPRYSVTDTNIFNESNSSSETFKTLTLNLGATYQIARNISLIGSYTFYRQTTDRRGDADIDQNRVFLGVQYAYPINFY